ncbi:hypothetical protein Ani05nite_10280 [Amorphoplanes nipponensis]|uniref:Uncharacterized protein n=1 Tax=Actinoplanes nipponensis TaxID=135950 RepID=A0A919MFG0_9ACTN|nr:hypothetical protein Ani05nite_10280 [Actinoplanes nipponensis]
MFPAILASGLVMVGAVPASAEPAPTVISAKAAAGKKICKVTDPALPELSGIVATKNGFVVVNDGADEASRRKVFFLDRDCEITKKVDYPSRPLDTEDLALSPDGDTLWIADTGDNNARDKTGDTRATIGLWSMPANGAKEPKIHRLAYPDGDKHDAEALLFNGDGTPIIVTKEVSGKTLLYTPVSALKTNNDEGVRLKRAGEIELPSSDTPGTPIARLAQTTVTGGAVAPGGGRVTLRTYLDAYEWDVADGDVLGALKNKPRKTPLPNEPFGEAITYSADGKLFYTVSDMGAGADPEAANYILSYTPATTIAETKTDKAAAEADDGASWYADLSLTDITYLIGGVGVLGALLVGAGVIGIMQARKKRRLEPPTKNTDPTDDGPDPLDAKTELLSVGGPAERPGVYGGKRPPAGAPSGPGVYGGKPAAAGAPAKGNGVYGGGRPPQGGQPAGRPGQGGQPGGRPGQGGQPGGRPGQGGQGGRPGGAPAGPGGRPGVPPAGPGGRPGQGGQPGGRPGQGGQPGGRPGQGGQPAVRPGQPPARPVQQPARPAQPPARPAQQPARPAQQPARPVQPPGRPGQGGGGRPGGGVYGAPPPPPPSGGRPQGGGPQRPSGFLGQGGGQQGGQPPGRPDGGGRQANGMNSYANRNDSSRRAEGRFENPGYGRTPRGY